MIILKRKQYQSVSECFAYERYFGGAMRCISRPAAVASGMAINVMHNADMTLFARWHPITRLTLDPNGGFLLPGLVSQPRVLGEPVGDLPRPSRSGRSFVGWLDTNAFNGGTRFVPMDITPLWARWSAPSRHLI